MKTPIVLLVLLACTPLTAKAGWYHVDNYTGRIGAYPGHLSLQTHDSFGSGINVEGSYYYDTHMAPIPLYGKRTRSGSIELCEVHDKTAYQKYLVVGSKTAVDTSACPFKLTSNNANLQGTWTTGKKSHDVVLRHTGTLDNTTPHASSGTTRIPFWGQTTRHSFIGVYRGSGSGLSIDAVEVVDKASGKVVQTLDPQKHDCTFGFFMTPIYMNIETWGDDTRGSSEQVVLNCYATKRDSLAIYRLDTASNRYQFVPDESN